MWLSAWLTTALFGLFSGAVARLSRQGAVAFDQVTALGELTVRWTGADDGDITVSDDFDEGDRA